jgi:hypothetical protein
MVEAPVRAARFLRFHTRIFLHPALLPRHCGRTLTFLQLALE